MKHNIFFYLGLNEPALNQGIINPGLNSTLPNSAGPTHSANAAATSAAGATGGGGAAQQSAPAAAAAAGASGTTSWAAAAGKGLPPSEPSQNNGATNKQLEQLNSVREALFSQVVLFS